MELLKSIIEYGNSKISQAGLIERTFNLGMLVDKKYAAYTSAGQLTPLNDFDNYNGMSFWILRSIASVGEEDEITGGGELYTNTFSFDLIVTKKKNELACDGYGAEFEVYQRILKALAGTDFDLRTATTSRAATLRFRGYESAAREIPKRLDWVVMTIKIEVILKSNINCIPDVCATI
jgi:hypothetical protein